MNRFLLRPKWILFHLLVATAVVVMVNLGFWQLRRLDDRQNFNEQVEARLAVPTAPIADVLPAGTDPAAVEWRSVSATGTYLAAESIAVVNRSQGGIAGDMVVTPLRLDDGRILLVERGFVPLAEEAEAPPTGVVDVVGRLRPSQERRRGGLTDPIGGPLEEAQRIDLDRLATQLPGPVVPAYVELVASTPPEGAGFPEPVPPPELVAGPHLSYAVQWFIFSACAVVGWVLAVRHSVNARREPAVVATTSAPVGTASPSSR